MSSAYVVINTKAGTEKSLLKELKIYAIKDATIVIGEYDVVATIECHTYPDLKNCINDEVRYLDNVSSTMNLMAVRFA